jgi:hypothetical protein
MKGSTVPAKKIVAKSARKTAARSAAAPTAAAPKAAPKAASPQKPAKQRVRLVRDSFTMPETDFALIAALKARAMGAQREAKKSELLRAGLHALMALDGKALVAALGRLEPLKLGRPKKGH